MVAYRDLYLPLDQVYGARDRTRVIGSHRDTGFEVVRSKYPTSEFRANAFVGTYERMKDVAYKGGNPLYGLGDTTGIRNGDFGHPLWKETVFLSKPTDWSGIEYGSPSTALFRTMGNLYPSDVALSCATRPVESTAKLADTVGLPPDQAFGLGAEGIARALPSAPNFSLFSFLGELREGLPKLPGSSVMERYGKPGVTRRWSDLDAAGQSRALRDIRAAAGDETMNLVFAWIPGLGDLFSLIDCAWNVEALREKTINELSKPSRRRRAFPRESTSGIVTKTNVYPYPIVRQLMKPGTLTVETTTTRDTWVTSAFDTRLGEATTWSFLDRLSADLRAVGFEPNADNAWQLIPWSWLVDWFFSFGSVLKNVSYLGPTGTRLVRAYLMSHSVIETKYTWNGMLNGRSFQTSMTQKVETKQRVRATPYGFRFKTEGLSAKQIAILSILGLSGNSNLLDRAGNPY